MSRDGIVEVRRGEGVLVASDPTQSSEQRGTRPAIVLQNDAGNEAAPTTIVAPLTTSFDPDRIAPYETLVPATETDVEEDSMALLHQIRTVSIEHRIEANFGRVSTEVQHDVDRAIRISLGL